MRDRYFEYLDTLPSAPSFGKTTPWYVCPPWIYASQEDAQVTSNVRYGADPVVASRLLMAVFTPTNSNGVNAWWRLAVQNYLLLSEPVVSQLSVTDQANRQILAQLVAQVGNISNNALLSATIASGR